MLGIATKQSYPQDGRAGLAGLMSVKCSVPKLVISCTNGDRIMKFNNREKFEVKYSFLKPFSQNFEFLTSQKWKKKVPIGISCTNVDRKTKR